MLDIRRAFAFPLVIGLVVASAAADDEEAKIHKTETGLAYEIVKEGTAAAKPRIGDRVKIHFVGTLDDGTEFASSRKKDKPYEFPLSDKYLIKGLFEGVGMMTEGAVYRFWVPAELAYGKRGQPSRDAETPPIIPPSTDLIYEVELLSVTRVSKFERAAQADQQKTASGLRYMVLTEGKGESPDPAKDGVTLAFALWTRSGKKLLETAATGQRLSGLPRLVSLMRRPLPFVAEAVTLMKPGSRMRFEVPPALAFGKSPPRGLKVAPNSVTVWELELIRINPIPEFPTLDPEKLQTTASGIEYEVLAEGDGKQPGPTDEVEVHYTGWLTNGTIFDSSHGRAEKSEFPLDGVIKGWTEGIPLMKEGGTTVFRIPPGLAYGPRGSPPNVPPNATLIFQVQLFKVK